MCSAIAKDISEKIPKICTAYVIPLPNKLVPEKCETSRILNDDGIFLSHCSNVKIAWKSCQKILGAKFNSSHAIQCNMGIQIWKIYSDVQTGDTQVITKTLSTNFKTSFPIHRGTNNLTICPIYPPWMSRVTNVLQHLFFSFRIFSSLQGFKNVLKKSHTSCHFNCKYCLHATLISRVFVFINHNSSTPTKLTIAKYHPYSYFQSVFKLPWLLWEFFYGWLLLWRIWIWSIKTNTTWYHLYVKLKKKSQTYRNRIEKWLPGGPRKKNRS